MPSRLLPLALLFTLLAPRLVSAADLYSTTPDITLTTPVPPPEWALLERQLLDSQADACEEFFNRFFDPTSGYLLCVERWGGDDGPDDAIENLSEFPLLYALGGDPKILELYKKAWEGHLRQYTLAKTSKVPLALDGMYYKEFPVMFDWVHHGEGFTAFTFEGLADPSDFRYQNRAKRYAGLYMNEDPGAKNYDPDKKLIKSMFNGSRGPLLRKATGLDWAGDPIEVAHRFALRHGEQSYDEMILHFKDYNDVAGDHPLNLQATSMIFNAYALTGDEKYRRWLLDYVDAWTERMAANNGIIPSNVGLDGTLGGEAGGKWYGGVYGWAFTVYDPASKKPANRNMAQQGFLGFMNAYLLTGDDKYLQPWRRQMEIINAQGREENGVMAYPTMYGDDGWYAFTPASNNRQALPVWYLSQRLEDQEKVATDPWVQYLSGNAPQFPVQQLRADLESLRTKVAAMRADTTTPDTRLADDPLIYTPPVVGGLVQLMLGGLPPARNASPLFARLRYFDPVNHRPGLPKDVAALVEKMSSGELQLNLVNINPLEERTVTLQAGAYGEHQVTRALIPEQPELPLNTNRLTIKLPPATGTTLTLTMKRFANSPRTIQ